MLCVCIVGSPSKPRGSTVIVRRLSSPLLRRTVTGGRGYTGDTPIVIAHQPSPAGSTGHPYHQHSAGSIGRSASFKMPRASTAENSLTAPGSGPGFGGSKSLPTTPVERTASTEDREPFTPPPATSPLPPTSPAVFHPPVQLTPTPAAMTMTIGPTYLQATSAQKARAAWDRVKDIIHTK